MTITTAKTSTAATGGALPRRPARLGPVAGTEAGILVSARSVRTQECASSRPAPGSGARPSWDPKGSFVWRD